VSQQETRERIVVVEPNRHAPEMHRNATADGGDRRSVLSTRGINKHFGPVHALKNVDFDVFPGEVVALIGDNGAGKSTLINTITGVLTPESGEIIFDGVPVRFSAPHEARASGIETVYQDLAVAPHLDAVANIFLGRELVTGGLTGRLGFLDNDKMRSETESQLSRLRVRVPDLERRLVTLSGGQRQGVAVARAVMWASKIVIMDEPTAALGVAQTAMVLDLVRQVRDTGIPVVFISHNMPNVFQVADRIVVLRLGEVITELDPQTATIDDAVAAMTGSTRFVREAAARE
jgi:simple sugar transport system ATP-binding protein